MYFVFLVGYNIGVMNSPADYMKIWCNETLIQRYNLHMTKEELETLWSSIISIFLIGGCIGSIVGASLADKWGRKASLLCCGVMLCVSAVLFFLCRTVGSVEILLLARLIIGLASGLTTSILPMYLSEIAPLELRGSIAVLTGLGKFERNKYFLLFYVKSINQNYLLLGITGGVVVAQVMTLQEIFGTEESWHLALSAYLILVLLCYIPYPWFPESPKYLFIVARNREYARKELKRLRGLNESDRVNLELESMETEAITQSQTRSIWSVLTDSSLLMPVILVSALQGGQQLSGVNAVFYYSTEIFKSVGLAPATAKWANLGVGCVNLLTAFFTPLIMDRYNRRPVILLSCFVSGIFLVILAFVVEYANVIECFKIGSVIAIFGYILFYQIGLGPIPYFVGSELFEVSTRPAGMSIGSLASWACNFYIGMTFIQMKNAMNAFVFLPFAAVCFGLVALMYRYLPETRGKQPADVAPLVSHGFSSRRQ